MEDKKLQMIKEDFDKLSRMSEKLFESWQDGMAKHFSDGCIDAISREWKHCVEYITPYLLDMKKYEQEIYDCLEQCKRR